MGKATIVSGGTDGKYMVKMDYGKAAQTANLERITKRQTELVGLQAAALQDLNLEMIIESLSLEAVENAIRDYVDAAADASATQQALADAELANSTIAASTTATPAEKAAAAAAVVAAKTAAQNAAESFKKVPGAHAAALAKLVAAKAKTAKLQLVWQILKDEQTQLQKDQDYWAGLKLEETKEVWCADFSEDAKGIVEIMEIPGEDLKVLIGPQDEGHKLTNVGALTAREVQSPAQVFFNAAILPGWQKFKPMYRRGVVTKVDQDGDTVDVTFDDDKSSAQKLDINRYKKLAGIPVKYMACNAGVFEKGDHCVVKFTNQNWSFPVVVGFVDNPKPCGYRVLSGAVRSGILISDGGAIKLHDYLPTQDALDMLLKRFPDYSSGFGPSRALAVAVTPALAAPDGSGNSQYQAIKPTLYSGKMAKLVQVLMGSGENLVSPGFAVEYDYRWSKTHGVCTAADGALWLIEISAENGVRIMRLPVFAASPKCAATDAAKELFKGVPTGKSFPVGEKLESALASKKVLQLLDAADMAPFYEKNGHSSASGWTLNDAGTEAHNTCWHDAPMAEGRASCKWSSHYKIDITISGLMDPPPPVPPALAGPQVIQASAALNLVDTGRTMLPPDIGPLMMLHDPDAGGMVAAGATRISDFGYSDKTYKDFPSDSTIYVFYANDVLKRVRYKWNPGSYPHEYFGQYFPHPFFAGESQLSERYNGRRLPVVNIEGENPDYPDQLGMVSTIRSLSYGGVVINLGSEPEPGVVYQNRYYGRLATFVRDMLDFSAFYNGFSTVKGDRNSCALMNYRKTSRETRGDIFYGIQTATDPRTIALVAGDYAYPIQKYTFEFIARGGFDPTLPFGASWELPSGFSVDVRTGEGGPGDQYVRQDIYYSSWPGGVSEPVIDPNGYPDGREMAKEVVYKSDGTTDGGEFSDSEALEKSDQWYSLWMSANSTGHSPALAFAGTRSVFGGGQSVGNKTLGGDIMHAGDLLAGEPTTAVADYTFIGYT